MIIVTFATKSLAAIMIVRMLNHQKLQGKGTKRSKRFGLQSFMTTSRLFLQLRNIKEIRVNVKVDKKNTLHFRDSVKYLPMKLDQTPSVFELGTKSKGHFPYLYNHPDHYGKVLPNLPPIEYYEPNQMNAKVKQEFEQWYSENKDKPFDFYEEIVEYCKTDVQILTEAIVKYIQCRP